MHSYLSEAHVPRAPRAHMRVIRITAGARHTIINTEMESSYLIMDRWALAFDDSQFARRPKPVPDEMVAMLAK